MRFVKEEVVIVEVEASIVLLSTERVFVFLGILGGLLLTSLRHLAGFDIQFYSFVLRCLGTDTIVA